MTKEEKKAYHKAYSKVYYVENKEQIKERNNKYSNTPRVKKMRKIVAARYYAENKERIKTRHAKYDAERKEMQTIYAHHHFIFTPSTDAIKRSYENMPFYDGWNPDKGGSYKMGEQWIIENLGKGKPEQSMHIIKHELGFVPGNLAWATRKVQQKEQMFKIIARLEHENKELKDENEELKLLFAEAVCQKVA